MTEQMKMTIARSLEARITQCVEELRILRTGPQFNEIHEHLSYWEGERQAAYAALGAIRKCECAA